jgi:hypothetical protein
MPEQFLAQRFLRQCGRRLAAPALLLAFVGCSRSEKSEVPRKPPAASPPQAASNAPAPAAPSVTRHPGGPRVVAIGDLHGDLSATRAALRLAGVIGAEERWTGGSLVLVQTGDQLDRGDDERAIVDLFERLASEARSAGGAVLALNGNHETMNVQGDFRYVTPRGFRTFEGVSPESPLAVNFPPAERQRAAAFLPGGAYAQKLATRDVIAVVQDTVFAHAGVHMAHVTYGIDRINREVREWIGGRTSALPAAVAAENAPVWTRFYGGPNPDSTVCQELQRVLSALNARRMVVGHTIQEGGVSAACEGKLFRIDVGMSRHYGDNPIQVLEITGDSVRTLSGTRESLLDPREPQSGGGSPLKR